MAGPDSCSAVMAFDRNGMCYAMWVRRKYYNRILAYLSIKRPAKNPFQWAISCITR